MEKEGLVTNPQGKGVTRIGRGGDYGMRDLRFGGVWWPVARPTGKCACCVLGIFPGGHVCPK